MKNSEHERNAPENSVLNPVACTQSNSAMMQKGRDANPATHKPTAPEEGKKLLLQGTREHLLSLPVGLEQVPIGMIMILF